MGRGRGVKTTKDEKQDIIEMINTAHKNGARKRKACELLGINIRTIERWEKNGLNDNRKGALKKISNKLSLDERKKVIDISCNEKYRNLPPEKIVAMLADKGVYIASESTFRRVLKAEGLLRYRGESKPRKNNYSPPELIATAPNQVWSWDITYLKTEIKGKFYYLYLIMDVWSRLITGYSVHEEESGVHSSRLIKESCLKHGVKKGELNFHSDNGSPMKCATMLATLEWLGVNPTFSRPAISNDNAYSESLFKTLKFKSGYPKYFKTLEDAKSWVIGFVRWYNEEHLHSKIKDVTPIQRHKRDDIKILENRKIIYEEAKKKNPERWSKGKIRNWDRENIVILNPKKGGSEKKMTA